MIRPLVVISRTVPVTRRPALISHAESTSHNPAKIASVISTVKGDTLKTASWLQECKAMVPTPMSANAKKLVRRHTQPRFPDSSGF